VRITEMQQSLDRILADATPAPVGTTGTTSPTTPEPATSSRVVVDRARLVQLRQQLDAMLAALDRRR
jgi:hypothetical protein